MRKASLLAAVVAAFATIGCADSDAVGARVSESATASAPAATASVGAPAPAFTLEDQTGAKVSLADYAGKIVVLEWINPDCPFVQRHARAQTMKTLAEKYAGANVVWLGINSTHYANTDTNAKWVSENGLAYKVLDDHTGEVGRAYGAKTTPHMYVVDTKGNLVYQGGIDDDPSGDKGASATNYVAKALDALTAGKA
jgi:peroxiredoxin